MPDRLTVDDESLLPVQAFFNAVSDESFLHVIDSLVNGAGCVINDCGCLFPGDLDSGDEIFAGVQFFLFEQTVVISNQELAGLIKEVCRRFADRNPAEQGNVARILSRL